MPVSKALVMLVVSVSVLLGAFPAFAHGVSITHTINPETGEVTVTARYDTGDVLAGAQVAVFSPADFVTPWATGFTGDDGVYRFTPDYTQEGTWDVQVRLAGHGGLLHLPLAAAMAPVVGDAMTQDAAPLLLPEGQPIVISGDAVFEVRGDIVITGEGVASGVTEAAPGSAGTAFTPVQVIVMALSILWGSMGTALYFVQRRERRAGSVHYIQNIQREG